MLYEEIAKLIQRQIAAGTLRADDKIPSVRAMSRSARVSVATVVQAYLRLEAAGVIFARPQSGFFVRNSGSRRRSQPIPHASRSTRARSVAGEVLDTCIETMRRADLLALGGATPSADWYPHRHLNRLIREVVREHPRSASELVLPPGDLDLRREIAKRMAAAGSATDHDEVMITSGAMDAITLSLRTLCKPGDTVLVESPTYFGILQAIDYSGLKVVEVPNRPGVGIDAEAVRLVVKATKVAAAILMPSCNNPTGNLTSDEDKKAIVDTLTGAGIPIIEDDVYGDLHHGLRRPRSLRSFDESGLVICCGSVSKSIALGFRIGWAVSSQFCGELARAKFFSSLACPTLQQKVLARYYASGGYDRYLSRLRQVIAVNAQQMAEAIGRYFPEGTKISRPAGGVVVWVELPAAVDSVKLFQTALESRISIFPGIIFSASARYRNYIRLNSSLNWSPEIDKAVQKLGILVSQQ